MEKSEKLTKAIEWLKEYLSDGNLHLVDTVREAFKATGFTRGEIKAARKALGVKTFHQCDEDGITPNHFWYIEE